MKVLVANPPWPGEGYGARSDVRWPHKRMDKYLEYPIYLAYIVAVLEEAGFEVAFIDAVMEEMSIAAFSESVAKIGPDLVVIECSTPSRPPSCTNGSNENAPTDGSTSGNSPWDRR